MGYGEYLCDLLRPLGVYDLEDGSISRAELDAVGAVMDDVAAQIARSEGESITATALDEGLSRREALFARHPVNVSDALRREAITALCRIGNDSFTPEAINAAVNGCGIHACVEEKEEKGKVRVTFPDTAGEPEDFARIEKILLDIIPCHLETEFYFRYLTFDECAAYGWTWDSVEEAAHAWDSFELAV